VNIFENRMRARHLVPLQVGKKVCFYFAKLLPSMGEFREKKGVGVFDVCKIRLILSAGHQFEIGLAQSFNQFADAFKTGERLNEIIPTNYEEDELINCRNQKGHKLSKKEI